MKWIKRIIFSILIITVYFSLFRPIRSVLIQSIHESSNYKTLTTENIILRSTSIQLIPKIVDYEASKTLKSPFGLFFLISTLGLVLLGVPVRNLGYLIILHSTLWVFAFLFFKAGISLNIFFIEIMDLFNRYLIPITTLGFIPLVFMIQKSKTKSQA